MYFPNIEARWNYSDLVCTGSTDTPKRTGIVEKFGDADRDQLVSTAKLETCFKAEKPVVRIQVLGDSVVAIGEMHGGGYAYSGPPPGFVTAGRNLLFLRRTSDPLRWRVTIPVYEVCIELADVAPSYNLDGSEEAIRRALVDEFEAKVEQDDLRSTTNPNHTTPEQFKDTASLYLPWVYELLGERSALSEFYRRMLESSRELRRDYAMALLRYGDPRGEPDAISLLKDDSAPHWRRVHAAHALQHATSAESREALEHLARAAKDPELRRMAAESLSRMRSR